MDILRQQSMCPCICAALLLDTKLTFGSGKMDVAARTDGEDIPVAENGTVTLSSLK